jgi:hypothetical protein
VATAVVEDVHGFEPAGVPDPANGVVDPAQTLNVPVIVGNAFTVTVAVPETDCPHDVPVV